MPNPDLCQECRYGLGIACYHPDVPRVYHRPNGLVWCLDRQPGTSLSLRLALRQAHEIAKAQWEATV